MTEVEIRSVDERDNSWTEGLPRFRVYLHGSGDSTTAGWTDTYDLIGVDVLQVIDWAQRQAGETLTYAVALVYDDKALEMLNPGCGRGLVWLVGMDGNDWPRSNQEVNVQRRMLARRRDSVIVPLADRIPPSVPDPYNDGTAPGIQCHTDPDDS